MEGCIYNIQHLSLHDGPGIRSTVFLKGCSLNCAWCHNPESISPRLQMLYDPARCIGCGACEEACAHGAQRIEAEGLHAFLPAHCVGCGACAEVCYAGAMERCGRLYTSEQVCSEVLRDKLLYESSGGGVTFSGGEPLLQAAFVAETAALLRAKGVAVAVDTALHLPWEQVAQVLPYADLFLVDIKAADAALHRRYVGASNTRIHENLKKLAAAGKPIWIRIPVIGGVNDTEAEMEAIAALLRQVQGAIKQIDLLTYHDLGIAKAAKLGRAMEAFYAPQPEKMERFAAQFQGICADIRID